jgi:hypothetical protein
MQLPVVVLVIDVFSQQQLTIATPLWCPCPCLLPLLPLPPSGVAHFTEEQGFKNMYPHNGAWGLWYLPGSKRFREWQGRGGRMWQVLVVAQASQCLGVLQQDSAAGVGGAGNPSLGVTSAAQQLLLKTRGQKTLANFSVPPCVPMPAPADLLCLSLLHAALPPSRCVVDGGG